MSIQLEAKAAIQIRKPAAEVFQAIIDPDKMRHYFISQSTGRMEEGKNLVWRFPEFDMDCPVRVGKIEPDRYISFYWGGDNGNELFTEIVLKPCENNKSTVVTVTEKGMENNEAGISWLRGNTEGWANFLACMKAWLEFGVHLREGAFDFMKTA